MDVIDHHSLFGRASWLERQRFSRMNPYTEITKLNEVSFLRLERWELFKKTFTADHLTWRAFCFIFRVNSFLISQPVHNIGYSLARRFINIPSN